MFQTANLPISAGAELSTCEIPISPPAAPEATLVTVPTLNATKIAIMAMTAPAAPTTPPMIAGAAETFSSHV